MSVQAYLKTGLAAAALAGVLVFAGCDREPSVRSYTVAKAPPGPPTVVLASDTTPAPPATSAKTTTKNGLQWKLPAGWVDVPVNDNIRHAAFAVSEKTPGVQVTVTPLGPQETLPNVVRWQGQLGLPPSDAQSLDKVVRKMDVAGVPVEMVDLVSPPGDDRKRMLAAIVQRPDRYWFVKLMGPAETVEAQAENFESFVRSMRFTEEPEPALSKPADLAKWAAPSGWVEDKSGPAAGAVVQRILSYKVPGDAGPAVVAVTKLPANSTGSLLDNVNRWRAQVGLAQVASADGEKVDRIAVRGNTWPMFDFVGVAKDDKPAVRMLVALGLQGNEIWFVKMTGPVSTVESGKPGFVEFLKSLQFSSEMIGE